MAQKVHICMAWIEDECATLLKWHERIPLILFRWILAVKEVDKVLLKPEHTYINAKCYTKNHKLRIPTI